MVDPGFSPERVRAMLDAEGRRPVATFATHGHFDHIGSAAVFCGNDLPFYIHEADVAALTDPQGWGAVADAARPREGRSNRGGRDVLTFAGFAIEVLHTPGHTPGSVCLSTDAVLLGRPRVRGRDRPERLPNSSPTDMERSLDRFLELPDPTDVLPATVPGPRSGANANATPSVTGGLPLALALAPRAPGPPPGALSGAAAAARDRRPAAAAGLRRDAGAVRGRPPDRSPVRIPLRRDADLRAHGAVRAHVGRDLRRRHEGDVHVRGQGRATSRCVPSRRPASSARISSTPTTCRRRSRPTTCRRSSAMDGRRPGACASSGSSGSRRSGPRP